ncbi:unnamed protein product [Trifolium pratense]|uniref:Uncharacterized protein n=1 Tax=Trifolium pratense TaxID=57577 RepID=A0ACB0IR41_TRIPR|nr:unnamed protein product [Trifolium pratense]
MISVIHHDLERKEETWRRRKKLGEEGRSLEKKESNRPLPMNSSPSKAVIKQQEGDVLPINRIFFKRTRNFSLILHRLTLIMRNHHIFILVKRFNFFSDILVSVINLE